MDEDIDWDQVGEMEEDTDEENEADTELVRDPVMEAVFAVVREGEADAVALIDGVEANVAERERLWLWLKVEDPDPDIVAIEDAVMNLLADMETEGDEDGVLLDDVEGDTDWTDDDVDVPEAGSVATSNPMDAGGIHNSRGAVGSEHGRA
jgi:hypothetical protein